MRLGRDFLAGTPVDLAGGEKLDAAAVRFVQERYESLRGELARRIIGLEEVIEELAICLFAGGHALLVGVPGLAKTLLIRSLGELLSMSFSRIQFTPDLMPSDITGTEVIFRDATTNERSFRFMKGPIFGNLLLADEINRTPPKTQAALLEAMEEGMVTSVGKRHALDPPFFVMATQNPIEQEGTYPLPVSQLDRFMFNCKLDYPTEGEEYRIVRRTVPADPAPLQPIMTRDEVLRVIGWVRQVKIAEGPLQFAVHLGRASRASHLESPSFVKEWVQWGAGPRAPQYLILAAKARALLRGRTDVREEDIRAVARPTLRHRLVLSFHADADGVTVDSIVDRLLAEPAPAGR